MCVQHIPSPLENARQMVCENRPLAWKVMLLVSGVAPFPRQKEAYCVRDDRPSIGPGDHPRGLQLISMRHERVLWSPGMIWAFTHIHAA